MFEYDLGAMYVGFNCADRLLDNQFHTDGSREVEDDVGTIDELRQKGLVIHRPDRVLEARPTLEMDDIVDGASREVVENQDLMSVGDKPLGEVRPDETGPAGDQCSHAAKSSGNSHTRPATNSMSSSSIAG